MSHSLKFKTSKSSSAIFWVYLSAVRLISSRSSGDVRRSPACRHCFTAASHPMREKMKVIAGNKLSPCNFSMMSARDIRSLGSAKRPLRFLPKEARLVISRSRFSTSGLTRPGASKRSNKRFPINTCWNKGIGRISLTITSVSPRTSPNHSPNSSALETVAESEIT